jgi:hypothetical protein
MNEFFRIALDLSGVCFVAICFFAFAGMALSGFIEESEEMKIKKP